MHPEFEGKKIGSTLHVVHGCSASISLFACSRLPRWCHCRHNLSPCLILLSQGTPPMSSSSPVCRVSVRHAVHGWCLPKRLIGTLIEGGVSWESHWTQGPQNFLPKACCKVQWTGIYQDMQACAARCVEVLAFLHSSRRKLLACRCVGSWPLDLRFLATSCADCRLHVAQQLLACLISVCALCLSSESMGVVQSWESVSWINTKETQNKKHSLIQKN